MDDPRFTEILGDIRDLEKKVSELEQKIGITFGVLVVVALLIPLLVWVGDN